MRRDAAIALLQQMAWCLGHGQGDDPGNQFVMLAVTCQQWPQINAAIAEQAEMKFAGRRYAQAVAACAKVF